ncbi:MAG: phospholipase [Gammaproteobacteria bacterium]|nr:phospholipase [Gammaproteobacteria bacterium]
MVAVSGDPASGGRPRLLLFVHGWGVTRTDTYGGLPACLAASMAALDVVDVWLGRYVSFRDSVRLDDVAQAFDAAVRDVLAGYPPHTRFACITHSTGGPVLRAWLSRYWIDNGRWAQTPCPLSHLIMLAPPNFGSALAPLGKGRLGRMKALFNGVEPGQQILDWLTHGSEAACALNLRWLETDQAQRLAGLAHPVFCFVITGDRIDRHLYDHLNSYTGEVGSDGVVRAAAANLNATYVRLEQPAVMPGMPLKTGLDGLGRLHPVRRHAVRDVPFKLLGLAHSGRDLGILRSVDADDAGHPTVQAVLRCLQIREPRAYVELARTFEAENIAYQHAQRLEVQTRPLIGERSFIHDPHSLLLVRVFDQDGRPLPDVDLLLTAGRRDSPDLLPTGFMTDRQAHPQIPGVLSFYLNHAVLAGCEAVTRDSPEGLQEVRPALRGAGRYGICALPQGGDDLVHWAPGMFSAREHSLLNDLRPHQTTWVDIVLTRVVRAGVFRLSRDLAVQRFDRAAPGDPV